MSKLKIQDLSFCKTVSGSQVLGEYSSQRWLNHFIRKNFDRTLSYEKNGLAIEAYETEDDYAVISYSPDGRKQIIGLVGQNQRGGNYAVSSSTVVQVKSL